MGWNRAHTFNEYKCYESAYGNAEAIHVLRKLLLNWVGFVESSYGNKQSCKGIHIVSIIETNLYDGTTDRTEQLPRPYKGDT